MTSDEIKKKCIELWNRNKGRNLESFLCDNPEIDSYLSDLLFGDEWFESKRNVFTCVVHGIDHRVLCRTCGKPLDVNKAKRGKIYCSHSCVMKNSDIQNKFKKSCLERYGAENPSQSEICLETRRNNTMKKYGVSHTSKTESYKEKYKSTCLNRYGVEYTLQVKEVREKCKRTCFEHYGVDNPFKSEKIRKKAEDTCLKRYGVCNVSHSDEIRNKIRRNNLVKYGVESTSSLPSVRKKYRDTMTERYGADCWFRTEAFRKETYSHFSRWSRYVIPMFSLDEFKGWNRDIVYEWKCAKCGNVFKQHICSFGREGMNNIPRCMKCYPYLGCGSSVCENEIYEFVKSVYSGIIVRNDRDVLEGKEIDVFLPDKNIGIEFDGVFFHNDKHWKNINYHLEKTEKCMEHGIRLIHVFEDEWLYHKEIVKDRIKSLLGLYEHRIFARKCKVVMLDEKQSAEFLNENHLQGAGNSSVRYGLTYNGELVSAMTFGKPRFNRKYDFEMIRYASRIGYQIVGGASKILSAFRSCHKGSILSYADRRYSDGRLYECLGFKLDHFSSPNYCWVWKRTRLSRYQTQKSRLAKILGDNFDESLSEEENMRFNGYSKIYDCGNMVYVLA